MSFLYFYLSLFGYLADDTHFTLFVEFEDIGVSVDAASWSWWVLFVVRQVR